MLIVHGHRSVPPEAKGAVLALGNFDGVHRGHQVLIARAVAEARREARPSGALVFDPHPIAFFRPDEPHFRLMTLDDKLALFDEMGLDVAVVLAFDAALANLEADRFIETILVDALRVSHIVVGYHFFFGRNRTGSVETLRELGRTHGFGVTVVEPVADRGQPFSSTDIRLHLAAGNVRAAAESLGRPWRVKGPVVGGAKRGTGLGFPTANVAMPKGTALGHGIYAVRVKIDGRSLDGAAYLGTRPTFDDGMPVLEVFLFDFEGDIYGRDIEVSFIEKVRDDRRFASVEELIAQMESDCAKAREILAATPFSSPRP